MKQRKSIRILSVLLALTLFLAFAPQFTLTAKAAPSGRCGDYLSWSFDESSGMLTISGYGDMDDFSEYDQFDENDNYIGHFSDIPWKDYTLQITGVSLPDGLTSVGAFAFSNCANLRSAVIPDGVTVIGENAFYECSALQSVSIPNSVTKISWVAFWKCESLKSVTIPASVKAIEYAAFAECSSLESISIPDTLETMEGYAFFLTGYYNNPNRWSNGLLYLGKWLIGAADNITGADIRPGTVGIAGDVFSSHFELTSVSIPEGMETIGSNAFFGCAQLSTIKLPNSIKHIGDGAFYETGYYNNPNRWSNGLLYLGNWLIDSLPGTGTVNVRPGTVGIAGAALRSQELYSVSLPESLRYIGEYAFYYCSFFFQLTIPNGVVSIEEGAFEGCSGLGYLVLPESVTSVGRWALDSFNSVTNVLVLNPDCNIYDEPYTFCDSGTIYGYPGSTAEAYARKYGYAFGSIADASFIDVLSYAYYAEPVAWAVESGITNGTSSYLFSPDSTCTRAQVVTFLWRAAGSPNPSSNRNPFTDVSPDQYYYNAVLWAVEQGITTGTSSNRFSPNSGCTRAQVVTFLWRAIGKPAPGSTYNPFTDVNPGEYYGQAVLWAVEKGITTGTSSTRFSPANTCTRAQIVTFLYRTYVRSGVPTGYDLVGISMPTRDLQRWNQDGSNLKKELQAAGYDVDLQFAANDPSMQISQIENMIAKGAQVLIVAAIDAEALGTVLEQAREAACAVIAYDRPIRSDAVSYYTTFDNYSVGAAQGKFIVDQLDLVNAGGKSYNLELIGGSPDDPDAYQFYSGAMTVLEPYIDAGTLKVVSGQVGFEDAATAGWSSEVAQSRFENLLSTYYADKQLDAVMASNDSTAQGVVVALENAYKDDVYPIITGQDCDIVSVKYILDDKQAMSIFKDTRLLAAKAVEMTDFILKGFAPPTNAEYTTVDGRFSYPAFYCEPTPCTRDMIQSLLVDAGYYTREELGLK